MGHPVLLSLQFWNKELDFKDAKTGLKSDFNFLMSPSKHLPDDVDYFRKWILKPESRAAIHVGDRTFDSYKSKVSGFLYDDWFKSVKVWIEDLLNNDYKV